MKLVFGLKIFSMEFKTRVRLFYKGVSMATDLEMEHIKQTKITLTIEEIGREFELEPHEIAIVLNKKLFYKKL